MTAPRKIDLFDLRYLFHVHFLFSLSDMDRLRFLQLVEETLERLPRRFKQKLENVAVLVEDYPERGLERQYPGLLLGLFHGVPKTRQSFFSLDMPAQIVLYQKNIESVCQDELEILGQIEKTLKHEIGHYFGLSEKDLRRKGY
jgi:predicted Zn-dependent protease with MMP-like domain